ncbi:MAG: hypothetical protein WKF75_13340 [Singulisphaera sp.]
MALEGIQGDPQLLLQLAAAGDGGQQVALPGGAGWPRNRPRSGWFSRTHMARPRRSYRPTRVGP